MSYNGGIDYGLLGDYDALPDIDVIADGIDAALRDLLEATPSTRRPTSTSTNGDRSAHNGATSILPQAVGRSNRGPAADMRAKRSRRSRSARKPASD